MTRAPLSLPLDKTALLLIDMQEEHRRDPRYIVEGYDSVLANSAHLLAAARHSGLPVLHAAFVRDFTKVPRRPLEPVNASGEPEFSAPDETLTAICPEVEPFPGEKVLQKNDLSCFAEDGFDLMLAETGAEWLVICGVWTEACVAATVRDALARGLHVLLVKDACGSGTGAMHQTGLLHLANRLYGGAVTDTAAAVQILTGHHALAWQFSHVVSLQFTTADFAELYHAL